jgi:transcriptional regulator with XRE-family HTH domain
MSKARKFSDQLRDAIKQATAEGESRYALAKATGVDQGNLTNFLLGKRGLSLDAIDALANHLGWKLTWPDANLTESKSPRRAKSKKAKE